MFRNCFASCTTCLTARREQSPADRGQSAPIAAGSVPEQVAPEVAPGAAQVPAAMGANSPEPPFETKLGFCNIMAKVKIRRVTVDQRVPVNVVTKKFLAALGFKPQQHAMPSELSELAAQACPGHYGWQTLCLSAPVGHRGHTSDVNFVVVGDDYHCDVLLGCEFNRLILRPGLGMYPNFLAPNEDTERQERERQERQERQAREAERAAVRKREYAKKLEQLRKEDPKSGGGAGEGTSA